MSYALVSAALKTRLESILTGAQVHRFQRYTREPPESAAFKALFKENAQNRLHTCIFNRVARRSETTTDNGLARITHEVEIAYLVAHDSLVTTNDLFEGNLEALCRSFETGDRTLGGAAHTHGSPDVRSIGESEFYGLHCYDARIFLLIEEVL